MQIFYGVRIDENKYKNKFFTELSNIISSGELFDENGSIKDFDFFDDRVAQYVTIFDWLNIPYNDDLKTLLTTLKDNIPENKSLIDTKTAEIITNNHRRHDLLEHIRMPEEHYLNLLNSENSDYMSNGRIKNILAYDKLLMEYLAMYGQQDFPLEKIETSLEKYMKSIPVAYLSRLRTYKDYLLPSVESKDCNEKRKEGVDKFLKRHSGRIARDILERLHEGENVDELKNKCSEYEFKRFKSIYMDTSIDPENPTEEDIEAMREKGYDGYTMEGFEKGLYQPNNGKYITARGAIPTFMSSMYQNQDHYTISKYVVRIQKYFKQINRPAGKMGEIYDYIKGLDTTGLIMKNLRIGEVVLGAKKEHINNAISLLCEADFEEAVKFFFNKELRESLESQSIDIYSLPATEKFMEIFIEKKCSSLKRDSYANVEAFAENYIRKRAANPKFDLNKEKVVSDLLQLHYTGKSAKNYAAILDEALSQNKNTIDKNKAETWVNQYIKSLKGGPVTDESEMETLSSYLGTLKANNKGMLKQEYIDFIISQAMSGNSVLRNKKYEYLVERAVEDLGKLDYIRQNNVSSAKYMYITRDYLDHNNTMGVHETSAQTICIKTSRISQLRTGNADVINTIFHENQHMKQTRDFYNKIPNNFIQYNMLKEYVMMNYVRGYYSRNYLNTYIEIEAREKGAERAAEYLARITPERYLESSIENIGDSVSELFASKIKDEKQRMEDKANEEKILYEKADKKTDEKGKEKSVGEIFRQNVSKNAIESNLRMYPGLEIEYNSDGSRKDFKEILDFAESKNLNLDMIKQIISSNKSMQVGSIQNTVSGMIHYINNNYKNKDKVNFMKDILCDNIYTFLSNSIDNFNAMASNGYNRATLESYANAYSMLKDIANAAQVEGSVYNYIFRNSQCSDKKCSASACIQEYLNCIKSKCPEIEKIAEEINRQDNSRMQEEEQRKKSKEKESRKGFFGIFGKKRYSDLKEISNGSDITGKRAVENYEKTIKRQNQETNLSNRGELD